jgi:DNA replication protein DnaD
VGDATLSLDYDEILKKFGKKTLDTVKKYRGDRNRQKRENRKRQKPKKKGKDNSGGESGCGE